MTTPKPQTARVNWQEPEILDPLAHEAGLAARARAEALLNRRFLLVGKGTIGIVCLRK